MENIPFYLYWMLLPCREPLVFPFFLILLGLIGYLLIGLHIVGPLKAWLREREEARLAADPAYALREQVRRAVIDRKLAALVEKNPKRHRAMMARKLGLSP